MAATILEELPFPSEWLEYNTSSGQVVLPSKIVKDLGVCLSNDIGWTAQVNEAVQSANKMANWVLSVFSTRSESVMLTLFRSLVRSRLEYSCPVWNPSLLGDMKKLESTVNTACLHSPYQRLPRSMLLGWAEKTWSHVTSKTA